MMTYHQITSQERYTLGLLRHGGLSPAAIARVLGRSVSITVGSAPGGFGRSEAWPYLLQDTQLLNVSDQFAMARLISGIPSASELNAVRTRNTLRRGSHP